jgi:DNA-binding LytR/AlgR family response regulator
MKALIIEDEVLAAERLTTLLAECDSSIEVIGQLDSIQDVIAYFQSGKNADIVFLDIQLADGKSFEIFDKVRIEVPIIFTTAFDQYALQAFKLHSIDYLLKPIEVNDLRNAIEKFKKLSAYKISLNESEIKALKDLLSQKSHAYKQRILVKAGNKLQYKPTHSVAYFFADGKTAYMIGKDGRKNMIDHTLEELEQMLNPENFFRISRKFIVNFEAVTEIKGLISSRLEVKLNQTFEHELLVSRERVHEFKAWLDR